MEQIIVDREHATFEAARIPRKRLGKSPTLDYQQQVLVFKKSEFILNKSTKVTRARTLEAKPAEISRHLILCNLSQFIVDQVVEGDDRAHQGGQIDHQHLVVGLDVERVGEVVVADVGQEVEDVLQLVRDLVTDFVLATADLLQIVLDITQLEIQSLQAEQLVRHFLGQAADGGVLDISQQVLNSDLFCFFSSDLTGNVLEGLRCGRSVLVHFFNCNVSLGGQAQVLRLRVNDDEDGVRAVAAKQLVDGDVVLVELGTGMIPADDALACVHFLEHPVH